MPPPFYHHSLIPDTGMTSSRLIIPHHHIITLFHPLSQSWLAAMIPVLAHTKNSRALAMHPFTLLVLLPASANRSRT